MQCCIIIKLHKSVTSLPNKVCTCNNDETFIFFFERASSSLLKDDAIATLFAHNADKQPSKRKFVITPAKNQQKENSAS